MIECEQTLRLMHIISRCQEDCDCQIWTGATNGVGHPKMQGFSVRRVVWEGSRYALRCDQLITTTCGHPGCLNPAHLKVTSKSEVAKISNARYSVKLKRSATSARSNRARFGKITMSIAREIRESQKLGKQLAKELGVSNSLISKVRQGKSWVDHTNPYLSLVGV